MTKNGPEAHNWFQLSSDSRLSDSHSGPPPIPVNRHEMAAFRPQEFLMPSWQGNELRSRTIVKIHSIISSYFHQLLKQLTPTLFTRQFRQILIEDYKSYLEAHDGELSLEMDAPMIWDYMWDKHSPHIDISNKFWKDYLHRSLFLHSIKIYCAYHCLDNIPERVRELKLMQAHNSLANLFNRGNQNIFNFESLRLSPYTSISPPLEFTKEILSLGEDFWSLDEFDLISIGRWDLCSISPVSWPHKIGLVHKLVTDLFDWIFDQKNLLKKKNPVVYFGDQIEEAFIGHWGHLKQTKTKEVANHPQILNFKFPLNAEGRFKMILNELFSLSYLAKHAKNNGRKCLDLIQDYFLEKENRFTQKGQLQTSLFAENQNLQQGPYDSIILNLVDFPKNNPHFHLISQISRQKENLISGGRLLVLSHKKLFVPSQSDKVNALLSDLKLEATFNVDTLKGKGDFAPYAYLFTKKIQPSHRLDKNLAPRLDMPKTFSTNSQDASVLSFRVSGELSHSGEMSNIGNHLSSFCQKKGPDSALMYQMEIADNLNLEFYLDAIVDGRLINSTSKDLSKITHPSFFRGLWKTCLPLEEFFLIDQIDPNGSEKSWALPRDFLGMSPSPEDKYQFMFIVDQRLSHKAVLEIIPANAYKVKKEEYGVSLCRYFGAIPKRSGVGPDLLRAYFHGPIGSQQVAMALSGSPNKLKGRLRTLLVPKFFADLKDVPRELAKLLSSFPTKKAEVHLSFSSSSTRHQLLEDLNGLSVHHHDSPLAVANALCNLQYLANEALNDLKAKRIDDQHFFSNPLIIDSIQKLESLPIYPKHPDLFIEFKSKGIDSLQLLYSHSELLSPKENDDIYELIIHSDLGPIFSLHGPKLLLEFCKYVLTATEGHNCLTILQGLRSPRGNELSKLLFIHDEIGEAIEDFINATSSQLNTLLRMNLISKDGLSSKV